MFVCANMGTGFLEVEKFLNVWFLTGPLEQLGLLFCNQNQASTKF